MQNELSHFAKHLITIIPDAVEPKHLAVKFQELAQLVHVTRRCCNLRYSCLLACASMRVFWKILWRIYLNTFTFKILLIATTHALLKESRQ